MNQAQLQQKQERLRQLQEEERQLRLQLQVQEHAATYQVELAWPARIVDSNGNAPRTNNELIQHRLLESGVLYEVPVRVGATVESTNAFIQDLEKTGCFNSVRVEVGQGVSDEDASTRVQKQLKITLDEKRWYRVNAGAGVKTDGWLRPETAVNDGFLPTAEIDVSVGLQNLTGCLDKTDLQYTLDTRSLATLSLSHEQPLYRMLPGSLRGWLLEQDYGSKYAFVAKAMVDTLDFERTRSYKEFQRSLSLRVCNQHSLASPDYTPDLYYGVEWSLLSRDLVPRRQSKMPYAMDASPEVVSQAGPSLKHSILAEFRSNGELLDHPYSPTGGVEMHGSAEVAVPPGSVGFVRCNGGFGIHMPLLESLSVHSIFNAGYLKALSFGGLCRPPTLSDRYYLGGPLRFRGFVPAGIGPRTKHGGSSTPGGDAVGGDFFYTATAMASITPTSGIQSVDSLVESLGVRLFSFASAGTCVGVVAHTPLSAIARSTRVSLGVGLATTALGPRLEATYAWPWRYGPADARQNAQFGFGFSFG
jgi:outer membrane protein assembly factor BamA